MARRHRIAIATVATSLVVTSQARADTGSAQVVLTATTDTGLYAAWAVDGSPESAWCEVPDAQGSLTITLPQKLDKVTLKMAHNGVDWFRVTVDGKRRESIFTWGSDHIEPLTFDAPIRTITLTPMSAQTACVFEVEAYTSDPAHVKEEGARHDEWLRNPNGVKTRLAQEPPPDPPRHAAVARSTHAASIDVVTTDALARAPDAIRALRLGLEDCDADSLAMWVRYPLRAGKQIFADAAAHGAACARGEHAAIAPSAADLDAALPRLTSEAAGELSLPVAGATWRFVWRHEQWWLAGIE